MSNISVRKVSATPTQVAYRNESDLDFTVRVWTKVGTVNRKAGRYNHIKKSIKVTDMVQVPNMCGSSCTQSPVVLELTWSAPEGISSDKYKNALMKAIEQLGGVGGVFIAGPDTLTFTE